MILPPRYALSMARQRLGSAAMPAAIDWYACIDRSPARRSLSSSCARLRGRLEQDLRRGRGSRADFVEREMSCRDSPASVTSSDASRVPVARWSAALAEVLSSRCPPRRDARYRRRNSLATRSIIHRRYATVSLDDCKHLLSSSPLLASQPARCPARRHDDGRIFLFTPFEFRADL